ncbi:hypothetical protein CDAR_288811 [Caerostris darwini]|uniref:Apple domain-containing protein n=1 Tax=Caerostris darwini TaxID=1538125 RepID=A0AAV4PJF8_9ARAC|nr:hypothetical protein CDAR_288811 [Caerostris darwini]
MNLDEQCSNYCAGVYEISADYDAQQVAVLSTSHFGKMSLDSCNLYYNSVERCLILIPRKFDKRANSTSVMAVKNFTRRAANNRREPIRHLAPGKERILDLSSSTVFPPFSPSSCTLQLKLY